MAWYHAQRRKILASVGEYRPERITVTVHDTFDQRRLDAAARVALGNGTRLAAFLLYCADYVIRHKPELAELHREYEEERRELQAKREKRERERAPWE
jgi:hypothetical protein